MSEITIIEKPEVSGEPELPEYGAGFLGEQISFLQTALDTDVLRDRLIDTMLEGIEEGTIDPDSYVATFFSEDRVVHQILDPNGYLKSIQNIDPSAQLVRAGSGVVARDKQDLPLIDFGDQQELTDARYPGKLFRGLGGLLVGFSADDPIMKLATTTFKAERERQLYVASAKTRLISQTSLETVEPGLDEPIAEPKAELLISEPSEVSDEVLVVFGTNRKSKKALRQRIVDAHRKARIAAYHERHPPNDSPTEDEILEDLEDLMRHFE